MPSDDEIKAADPRCAQSLQVEAFVGATDVSLVYLEKAYDLGLDAKAQRVYAAGVIGIAHFVPHGKKQRAALGPARPALMLGTLRWTKQIRSPDALGLPKEGQTANALKPAGLKIAGQLVDQWTAAWKPEQFKDVFTTTIQALGDCQSQGREDSHR